MHLGLAAKSWCAGISLTPTAPYRPHVEGVDFTRAAHFYQCLEHIGPHQLAPIHLFQILEQEESVPSVKCSYFFLVPFPSLGCKHRVSQLQVRRKACAFLLSSAQTKRSRLRKLVKDVLHSNMGNVAEDPKFLVFGAVGLGFSCRSGISMANTGRGGRGT